ncbi:hypothetical protein N8587_02355, partial [Akkermansiaceae bacterium]|nr:hypothetical protein [Akkermansiaceae bacterium]
NIRILSEPFYHDVSTIRASIKSKSLIGLIYIAILRKKINRNNHLAPSWQYVLVKNVSFSILKNCLALMLKILQTLCFFGEKGKKFYSKGYSVGIGGPDGSGKTTLTTHLYEELSQVFYVKRFSFGRLTASTIKKGSSNKAGGVYKIKKVGAGLLRFYLAQKIRLFKKLHFIVLSDRYYNYNGPGMDSFKLDDGKSFCNLERYIYNRIPPIDLMFLVDVPLSSSIARNRSRIKEGKEDDTEIRTRYQEFKSTKYKAKRHVVIENSKTVKEGIKKMKNELF